MFTRATPILRPRVDKVHPRSTPRGNMSGLRTPQKAMVNMQPFFSAYLDLLQDCHNGIFQALEGLPSEALDWTPGQDMNSISVLLAHITGSERYWIGDIAAQEPSNRDREAEFRVRGVEADVFRNKLADNLEFARNVLEKMSLQDLESTRVRPSDGREFNVAWALLHALEHATSHLGHIQMTRQLWEQRGGNS